MLYRENIAVCSEIHTKHINTLCGQNVELLNVKNGGTYSDHWAWKCVAVPRRKLTLSNSYAVLSLSCRCAGRAICSCTVLRRSKAVVRADWRCNGGSLGKISWNETVFELCVRVLCSAVCNVTSSEHNWIWYWRRRMLQRKTIGKVSLRHVLRRGNRVHGLIQCVFV
jgi:hypothetical protein